jgi:ABC-type transport system involved in cytochrome c biogenesis permease subunit
MENIIYIFSALLPLCYLVATGFYAAEFFNPSAQLKSLKRNALYFTAAAHFVYLSLLTVQNGFPPIASVFQLMTTIAFTLVLTYLFIELSTGESSTGSFVLAAALAFQSLSSVLISETVSPDASLKNPVLQLHIISAILGYGAIAIAGVYSLLYIVMLRQIQTNKFGTVFERLPNLETLETMSIRAVGFGFTFLTIAFLSGAAWIPQSGGRFTFGDAKLIGLIMVWAIYGASLLLRQRLGWQGKRMAVMLTIGFLFSFLSMTVMNFFSSRFHVIQ